LNGLELEQCINFILTKAQQAVHQVFKAELVPYGVTPGQYGVLMCLWDENGQTVRHLADRLTLDGSTMTGLLDRMEQKGLIEKKPDPKDRRALQVLLTDKGNELRDCLPQAIDAANKKVLEEMDENQVQAFKELLYNLCKN
jgi:DNA-binding MarR family transcriptional regulator